MPSDSRPSDSFPFLLLPKELRFEIYEHVLWQAPRLLPLARRDHTNEVFDQRTRKANAIRSLLATSKELRGELQYMISKSDHVCHYLAPHWGYPDFIGTAWKPKTLLPQGSSVEPRYLAFYLPHLTVVPRPPYPEIPYEAAWFEELEVMLRSRPQLERFELEWRHEWTCNLPSWMWNHYLRASIANGWVQIVQDSMDEEGRRATLPMYGHMVGGRDVHGKWLMQMYFEDGTAYDWHARTKAAIQPVVEGLFDEITLSAFRSTAMVWMGPKEFEETRGRKLGH